MRDDEYIYEGYREVTGRPLKVQHSLPIQLKQLPRPKWSGDVNNLRKKKINPRHFMLQAFQMWDTQLVIFLVTCYTVKHLIFSKLSLLAVVYI